MNLRTIGGRYELVEQIGDSSWRAVDTELGREVLVRLPAGEIATATLAHPNIVRLFDQGEEEGEPYAVLEYLLGGSLEQRLASGPLSGAEARGVAADVEAALAYAHAQGVMHGSLGPANVLLDAEGRAKVAGFTGDAEPEDDMRALGALLQVLGANAIGGPEADVT
jgi:serine/threonine-protein kinase